MADKESYFEEVEAELKKWQGEINRLKEDTKKFDQGVVTQYYEQVEDLMALHELARQKLQEVKEYGEAHWDDYKHSMDEAMENLTRSYDKLQDHFKSA